MKRSRQCISGNPDNFTVSISFEYELEIGGRDMGKMGKKYSQIQKN
jgi:hypothetical protein